jgi:hypothetical protein
MNEPEYQYVCVGICRVDPETGYCRGCGRPPLPVSISDQEIVVEAVRFDMEMSTASAAE